MHRTNSAKSHKLHTRWLRGALVESEVKHMCVRSARCSFASAYCTVSSTTNALRVASIATEVQFMHMRVPNNTVCIEVLCSSVDHQVDISVNSRNEKALNNAKNNVRARHNAFHFPITERWKWGSFKPFARWAHSTQIIFKGILGKLSLRAFIWYKFHCSALNAPHFTRPGRSAKSYTKTVL